MQCNAMQSMHLINLSSHLASIKFLGLFLFLSIVHVNHKSKKTKYTLICYNKAGYEYVWLSNYAFVCTVTYHVVWLFRWHCKTWSCTDEAKNASPEKCWASMYTNSFSRATVNCYPLLRFHLQRDASQKDTDNDCRIKRLHITNLRYTWGRTTPYIGDHPSVGLGEWS